MLDKINNDLETKSIFTFFNKKGSGSVYKKDDNYLIKIDTHYTKIEEIGDKSILIRFLNYLKKYL